ncbi:GNAT family N-acetyltransferase [Neobacillus vireti]|uniref:Acetyltransferase, gnat family protein n=1 Tax=Neobacillus vireti LMG 21834 TaxID=1131730 RepID=A0AB94IH34_9BACI|nr:GNAT family N-acetyltransferase [Neobacillus vireti]ETI66427.1 acetyltransferase, gnat family protein [Neobacillus vireti LMG 21834]KLT16078.1 GNAT family acetyltransferase [Neobacillus vireti]
MQLYIYDDSFKNKIEYYELTEEQLRSTGHPKDCIKLSNEDSDRYSILAIEEDKLVNFFVLHKNEGVKPYSSNNNSILLRAFSTDFRHQGRGYAKKSLMLLPEFVKENFSETNEIVLAVNLKNEAAQGLYKKCGFVDEGVRKMGKKGELIIMSYYL